VPNLHILAKEHIHRLGVISFYIDGLHYNVGVKMLNDKFGIQTRGGCSCAGTYGHYLLNVDTITSKEISAKIMGGDCSTRPGWIRMSLHPTMTDADLKEVLDGILSLATHFTEWMDDYVINHTLGIVQHTSEQKYNNLKTRMDHLLTAKLS
jgi:selenocysteine lyase/cysteine desulfurase